MKHVYSACMDEAAIKQSGLTGIQDVVEEISRRFPVTDYLANETYGPADYDAMANVTSYLAKLSTRVFVEFSTVPDPVDPVIDPSTFPDIY